MRKTIIFIIIHIIIGPLNIYCQSDSIFPLLSDVHQISDGSSRYGIPKISPDGQKVLTTKNKGTLIYIDLRTSREFVLDTANSYPSYYWIDSARVFYYERHDPRTVELGVLSISTYEHQILFSNKPLNLHNSNSSSRVPNILAGRYYVNYDIERKKVLRDEDGIIIELTNHPGVYYSFILSHRQDRIIIHKNDGCAYNHDFNGVAESWRLVNGLVCSWSPDDKYLLYFFDEEGKDGDYTSELYICTADGKSNKQLTKTADIREMFPSWADKSDVIAFYDDIDRQLYIGNIKLK